MQNIQNALSESLSVDGALATAFADWKRGSYVAYKLSTSSDGFSRAELMLLVASSSEVIRNKAINNDRVGEGNIEEIVFVYENCFCLVQLVKPIVGLFFLLVLEREKANLGHARLKLAQIVSELQLSRN